ncbi:hypothetical protein [Actinoplanes nipponensis]|uniref:hypothetical protein n=1 Tax=Actinoplanes nipponensis TaxID=135950 RepID=UPI0031E6DAD9
MDRWVPSACLLCSNGCGCDIAVKDGRMVGVAAGPPTWSPRPPRPQGPVRQHRVGALARSPHPAAGPGERPAGGDRRDTAMGRIVEVSGGCWPRRGRCRTASTPAVSCSRRSTTRSR